MRGEQSLQVLALSTAQRERERGPFLCNLWFHSTSISDDCLGEEKAILRGTGCVKRIVSPAAHPSMSNQLHGTEGQQNYWRRGWLRHRRQWYGLNPHLEVPFPHLTPPAKVLFFHVMKCDSSLVKQESPVREVILRCVATSRRAQIPLSKARHCGLSGPYVRRQFNHSKTPFA